MDELRIYEHVFIIAGNNSYSVFIYINKDGLFLRCSHIM
jgi:hypothetical protein